MTNQASKKDRGSGLASSEQATSTEQTHALGIEGAVSGSEQTSRLSEPTQPEQDKSFLGLVMEAFQLEVRLESVKPVYKKLDEIYLLLGKHSDATGLALKQLGVSDQVSLVDNFENSNNHFKATSVKRYELKLAHPRKMRFSELKFKKGEK